MAEKCPVCEKVKEVCKEAGKEGICAALFGQLEKNEITTSQFVDGLLQIPEVKKKLEVPDEMDKGAERAAD